MQPPRAPLFVFLAAFCTFLMAFAALCAIVKPELDRRAATVATERAGNAGTGAAARSGDMGANPAATAANAGRPKDAARGTAAHPGGPVERGPVTVTGRAVDGRGEPLRNGRAHLLIPPDRASDQPVVLASAECDRDGAFTLVAQKLPRTACAQVAAHGFLRSERVPVSDTQGLAVALGNIALKPGFALRVRVSSDEEGAGGVSGARIVLVDADAEPEALRHANLETKTDGSGTATFRGVDVGSWRLRVSAPGFARADVDWTMLRVPEGNETDSAVALLRCLEAVRGAAFDLDQNPILRGEVAVRLVHPEPPADQEWRGALQPDGTFEIGPLPHGTFSVELAVPGMVQNSKVYAEAGGEPVELVAEHGGVVIGRIQAPVPSLPAAPMISILRRDPQGRFQPFDGACRIDRKPTALAFRIDGLPAGDYVVRLATDGFAPARSDPFRLDAGCVRDGVTVRFGNGGSIGGRLVDARGNAVTTARVSVFEGLAPPPPALAELFPLDARSTTFVDAEGRFRLASLSPGAQVLVLEAEGQPPRTIGPLWIAEDGDVALGPLTLGGGSILSVSMVAKKGQPPAPARGRLRSDDGAISIAFIADELGNFCLRGLAPGGYRLVAEGEAGDGEPLDLILGRDETKRIEYPLGGH